MQNTFGIAAYRSRQQVLLLENALRREGVNAGVITTPREVALGCGLSVRFSMEDLGKVQTAVRRLRPASLIGVYRVDSGGGRTHLTPMGKYRS